MEFDFAARRLASDQSKLRKQRERRRRGNEISAKAKQEAQMRRKLEEERAAERRARQEDRQHQEQYFHQCERDLKVRSLGNAAGTFQPTSIHGQGDKIALPPSVLEHLTSAATGMGGDSLNQTAESSPWTFRIGLLDPNYEFPASPLIQNMKAPNEAAMDEDDESLSDEEEDTMMMAAYLDELDKKYLRYTHGTVVEFTQEDGQVGLPEPIANALLSPLHNSAQHVPVKRTVDPSRGAESTNDEMKVDSAGDNDEDDEEEKTPGHLAWGAFDLPDTPVEISMVQLPKGKSCTLTPTPQAINDGFYNLKDIKLVLEQSLIRTRATLTVGDTVHTWHRGKKFDLQVSAVKPVAYNAVVCINTDIEVEFGTPDGADESNGKPEKAGDTADSGSSDTWIGGRVLSALPIETTEQTADAADSTISPPPGESTPLRPEPPLSQTEGVCTVQIRGHGGHGKRRFDVRVSTVSDLFAFASSVIDHASATNFQLVTRFPRRVITESSDAGPQSLEEAGIQQGQELFMVERLGQ